MVCPPKHLSRDRLHIDNNLWEEIVEDMVCKIHFEPVGLVGIPLKTLRKRWEVTVGAECQKDPYTYFALSWMHSPSRDHSAIIQLTSRTLTSARLLRSSSTPRSRYFTAMCSGVMSDE